MIRRTSPNTLSNPHTEPGPTEVLKVRMPWLNCTKWQDQFARNDMLQLKSERIEIRFVGGHHRQPGVIRWLMLNL